MLSTLLYFFLALFILITFHEFGHFIVARLCGVKVLRFSFGFGKILAKWQDKRGTEFVWSAFPLGGYVKMLDETEGEVAEHEKHLAFNRQSVWARIAIVAAGPIFNLIFAFFALWLVLIIGIKALAPITDNIAPNSIAARAGLNPQQEILTVNNETISSWLDFEYALMPYVGTTDILHLVVKPLHSNEKTNIELSLANWHIDSKKPNLLASLGIEPFIPKIPPIVDEVFPDSPAYRAGIKKGDILLSIDNTPIKDWLILMEYVKNHPDMQVKLDIKRGQLNQNIVLQLGSQSKEGSKQGFLGVQSLVPKWPAGLLRTQRNDPIHAIPKAFKQTISLTKTTFILIGRLIVGKLPWQSMSGPVGIAQGAGESGRSGISYYLSFLALVSISLGVLNLLPIPILDGGHLVYCAFELIFRRPVPDNIKVAGMYFGFILLFILMAIALTNDLSRLIGA